MTVLIERPTRERPEAATCRCGTPGSFCAMHGEYTPAVTDFAVLDAVAEAARRRPAARRVIRKRGGLTW